MQSTNMSAWIVMGLMVLSAGCSNSGAVPGTEADCGSASDCAEGMLCADGLCVEVADPSQASDAADATVPNEADAADATDAADASDASDASDPTEDEPEPEPNDPVVVFTMPANQTSYEQFETVLFTATVSGVTDDDGPFAIVWQSNVDGSLQEETVTELSELSFETAALSPGNHTISLIVGSAAGGVGSSTLNVGICGWILVDDFESEIDPAVWHVHRDAYRDSRGWLEMTDNAMGKKGAIFNIGQALQPGNVTMRFKISTGQCSVPDTSCSSGSCAADGFAMSVYKTNSVEELEVLLESTQTGGGLGYSYVGGACSVTTDCPAGTVCTEGTCKTESFHIEFDTWYNGFDPTTVNHVGIMLNGDNATHHIYETMPTLEDNMWHEVVVSIQANNVEVMMDGSPLISGEVPDLNFKGGFIGFSGTTGSCTNYHRFDDLYLQPTCVFE
ncbi:MAG: hypothetical protein HOK97_16530 [Deltaproteobacteria bacterium]|jgi:hypothetical protein|nr:hypothetical protein [Deltaproteobacteria bacterium]MBT6491379.1 hypothetical protein [Deltaproteobacteria bacterium]